MWRIFIYFQITYRVYYFFLWRRVYYFFQVLLTLLTLRIFITNLLKTMKSWLITILTLKNYSFHYKRWLRNSRPKLATQTTFTVFTVFFGEENKTSTSPWSGVPEAFKEKTEKTVGRRRLPGGRTWDNELGLWGFYRTRPQTKEDRLHGRTATRFIGLTFMCYAYSLCISER